MRIILIVLVIAAGKPAGLFYGYKNLGVYEYDASNAWTQDYKNRLTPVFKRDNEGNVIIGLNGQPTLEKYLNQMVLNIQAKLLR